MSCSGIPMLAARVKTKTRNSPSFGAERNAWSNISQAFQSGTFLSALNGSMVRDLLPMIHIYLCVVLKSFSCTEMVMMSSPTIRR